MTRGGARGRGAYPPPRKRLGQHFLTDERVVDRIADALEIRPGDTVVEIGPGRGVLTDRLVQRAARVVAVELDDTLAVMLRDRYAAQRPPAVVEIVQADVLKVSLGTLAGDDYVLAGNVPYYITTPILFHALKPPMPRRAVFLVQREVAERATAPAGGKIYGALSVNLQGVSRVEHLFDVPPGAFRPPPTVDSSVLRLTPLAQPLVADELRLPFQRFVQQLFGMRRKQLSRTLRTILLRDAETVAAALHAVGIDPAARPETLTPGDFVRLFDGVRALLPGVHQGEG